MGQWKKELIQFLTWMRNGIAFCTSWFLILWLIYNYYYGIDSIRTESLGKMLLFVVGGAFLFCFFFTRLFMKRWRFVSRLTGFLCVFSLYECIAFYELGIFGGTGSFKEWLTFVGIVLASYVLCIVIYQLYSRKKGEMYTQALQNYQMKRRLEHGE